MLIRYLGHACFYIQQGNDALVIDPYDPSTGPLPPVSAPLVLVSHGHHDHAYPQGVSGVQMIVDKPGPWQLGGMSGEGIATFHDDQGGAQRGGNIAQVIHVGGQRVVHLGDLGHIPDAAQLEMIKGCDLLLIPVGGYYTIDAATATALCDKIAPRVTVPMHYKIPSRPGSPIADVEEFLRGKEVTRLEGDSFDPKDRSGIVLLTAL